MAISLFTARGKAATKSNPLNTESTE